VISVTAENVRIHILPGKRSVNVTRHYEREKQNAPDAINSTETD
jgi:hypothetical protein